MSLEKNRILNQSYRSSGKKNLTTSSPDHSLIIKPSFNID